MLVLVVSACMAPATPKETSPPPATPPPAIVTASSYWFNGSFPAAMSVCVFLCVGPLNMKRYDVPLTDVTVTGLKYRLEWASRNVPLCEHLRLQFYSTERFEGYGTGTQLAYHFGPSPLAGDVNAPPFVLNKTASLEAVLMPRQNEMGLLLWGSTDIDYRLKVDLTYRNTTYEDTHPSPTPTTSRTRPPQSLGPTPNPHVPVCTPLADA